MSYKRQAALLLFFLPVLSFSLFSAPDENPERGYFSVYFKDEMVGYEEYQWASEETGYVLSVQCRMTKPVDLLINSLIIRVDKNYIPYEFFFRGVVSGIEQEISSVISDGRIKNTIIVGGASQKSTAEIKEDAFLLPNPVFSPYMVITKKFRCTLKERIILSAYIIPQLESSFSLEPNTEIPCWLQMNIQNSQIELDTDEQGNLKAMIIPSQSLRVVRSDTCF